MSIVQWLLLILIIVVVAGAYWYLRHQAGNDPWQGMDEPDAADGTPDNGEALGGDSYIVGVRTITNSEPASRKASANGDAAPSGAAAEAAWQTYKRPAIDDPAAQPAPEDVAPEQAPAPEPPPAPANLQQRLDDGTSTARMDNIRPPQAPASEREIFILHVAKTGGMRLDGPDIHTALQACDLKFGLNDIYHRVTEIHGLPESVFSVANMLKPGTLDPVDQDHLTTPGLAFFLVVPGPLEGGPAMRDMMETANRIAQTLGADVLDDKRALLKAQTAQYMLDQIAELDRQAHLGRVRR